MTENTFKDLEKAMFLLHAARAILAHHYCHDDDAELTAEDRVAVLKAHGDACNGSEHLCRLLYANHEAAC